jgi:hypothetical protein
MFRGSAFHGKLPLPRLPEIEWRRYEPDIGLPAAALKITGAIKYYDKTADSGNMLSRGFCPECGSSLFGKTSAMPELAMITAGSLDDRACTSHPWTSSHPARSRGITWIRRRPNFPKMPPMAS